MKGTGLKGFRGDRGMAFISRTLSWMRGVCIYEVLEISRFVDQTAPVSPGRAFTLAELSLQHDSIALPFLFSSTAYVGRGLK